MKKTRLWIILIIFLNLIYVVNAEDILTISSPNYFEENTNIYEDIHFLKKEIFSFEFCSDEILDSKKVTLNCKDRDFEEELTIHENTNKENCFFSNYKIENLKCSEFDLNIDYQFQNKKRIVTRSFKEQKESKLINHVLNTDYTTLEPLDLSYYLTVLVEVETIESAITSEVYDLLKNIRDNTNKCWPQGDCVMGTTVEILLNLFLSGYEIDTRLLEDGKTYLNKKAINNDNEELDIVLEFEDIRLNDNTTIECDVTLDGETEDYKLDQSDTSINDRVGETIDIDCNSSVAEVNLYVFDIDGEVYISETYENLTTLDYDIEAFACLGDSTCDYYDTVNALTIYGDKLEDETLLLQYIEAKKIESNGEIFVNVDKKYTGGGKYLYYVEDEDILSYMKFKQNNDGSWSSEKLVDRVEDTVWAILGINQRDESAENVVDGKKWIYFNEPVTGWGTVKKNALAYLAIKEQIKPYLDIVPKNELEKINTFTITNPTIFKLRDVKVEFSEEIVDSLSFTQSLGDLDSEESVTLNVNVTKTITQPLTGEMKITGVNPQKNEIELFIVPINLQAEVFEISYDEKLDFTNTPTDNKIKLELTVIGDGQATCNYKDPLNDERDSTVIISSAQSQVVLTNLLLLEGEYSLTLSCTIDETYVIDVPIDFSITVLEPNIESTSLEIVIKDYNDVEIDVTSINEEDVEVTVTVTDSYNGILVPIEDQFTLIAGETKTVQFLMGDTTFLDFLDENQIKGNINLKTDKGYQFNIPIVKTPTEGLEDGGSSSSDGDGLSWWLIILIILVLAFIGLIIFRVVEMRMNQNDDEGTGEQHYNEEDEYI